MCNELEQVDALLMEYDGNGAFELLSEIYKKNGGDVEVGTLCRFCNALYICANSEEDHEKRVEFLERGRTYAIKATEKEPESSSAQKWAATLTGVLAEHCGDTKKRIQFGHEFKAYLDKALELDGGTNYPELYHMRGRFKFQVASLGIIERTLAVIFFGTVPYATYQDAMNDFMKSEELTPGELENTLFIAKTCHAMGDNEKAVTYLKKVIYNQPIDAIDGEHIEEARELMQKLDPMYFTKQEEETDE